MKAMYLGTLLGAVAVLSLGVPGYGSEMDDRIESSAKSSYVFKTYLQADDIKIQSTNGVVTLTGTVAEESHKALARETVASLPGVTTVDNKLALRGEGPAESSDAWLVTKVKTTLMFHRSVSGLKTEVSVKDGVVTLQGEATSDAQKDLTSEYAKDVEGVKEVKNEMVVTKPVETKSTIGEDIDDASITAQVKMTLLSHRSTSAFNTSVTTTKGVVTLIGKAKNTSEIDLASKLAGDVRGVSSVNNLMTVP